MSSEKESQHSIPAPGSILTLLVRDRVITFSGPSLQSVNNAFAAWLDKTPREVKLFSRHYVPGVKDLGYPLPAQAPNLMETASMNPNPVYIIDVIYTETIT